jgi:hypothetical protein
MVTQVKSEGTGKRFSLLEGGTVELFLQDSPVIWGRAVLHASMNTTIPGRTERDNTRLEQTA